MPRIFFFKAVNASPQFLDFAVGEVFKSLVCKRCGKIHLGKPNKLIFWQSVGFVHLYSHEGWLSG